jgi:hypothetical protein
MISEIDLNDLNDLNGLNDMILVTNDAFAVRN